MSYSHSKKWISTSQKEQQRWRNIEAELRRNFPKSPFPPRVYTQWVDFQLAERKRALESKLHEAENSRISGQEPSEANTESGEQQKQEQYLVNSSPQESSSSKTRSNPLPPPIATPFGGKAFDDGRSAVLGRPSIWRSDMEATAPSRQTAPWPNATEYKWEGDDRARSGVGRYLPLPRAGGNDTVAWHQRPMLEPLPFDAVRKVPTMEDVYSPVDEIPDADVCLLMSGGILIAVV